MGKGGKKVTPVRRFPCPYCKKVFGSYAALNDHLTKVHGGGNS